MDEFQPDFTHLLSVLKNERPVRLPLYEHHIDLPFICKYLDREIGLDGSSAKDYVAYHSQIIDFWKNMTYDAFDYEAGVCDVFPDHGALLGGRLGPIQTRADFEAYPWDEIPERFWKKYTPHLLAIRKALPLGMKAYGGCGYGIFESAQDLVGYESLCTMQYLDPELFRDLFQRIGDLYVVLWRRMIERYDDLFVFYRMGDDLGFKSSTLLAPETIRDFIVPQYRRVIQLAHDAGKKFLLHSCGNIFEVMEDLIGIGIDAKHSNEDEIAPFEKWIDLYSERIGLLGGIDVNVLSLHHYKEVYSVVLERGTRYRNMACGYGLGTGNSIPEYVPVDSFNAMIDASRQIRKNEGNPS